MGRRWRLELTQALRRRQASETACAGLKQGCTLPRVWPFTCLYLNAGHCNPHRPHMLHRGGRSDTEGEAHDSWRMGALPSWSCALGCFPLFAGGYSRTFRQMTTSSATWLAEGDDTALMTDG